MNLQKAKAKLKVTILVTLCLYYHISKGQNINEYFRFNEKDKSVISTGIKQINDSMVFGIASQLDSNSNTHLIIYSYDFPTQTLTLAKNIDNKQDEFRYIQTLPPQIDYLGRVCHAFSNDKQSDGRNGEFIIYDPQSQVLIDSIYKSLNKSGFSSFTQNLDSTFLLFGTSTQYDPNGDFYVVHVGKNGEFISDTTYGNTNLAERGYAITSTSDGGYAFTGSRRVKASGQPYRSKIVVYKFDSLGALEWTNQYGGDLLNFPYQIKSAENGNIYIVGVGSTVEITEDNFDYSPLILKINIKNGLKIWDTLLTLPPDSTNTFYQRGESTNILIQSDNLFITGYYNYFRERQIIPTNPGFIAQFDNSGNEAWRRYIYNDDFTKQNSSSVYKFYSIESTQNGGFLLGGTIEGKAPDPVGQYGWIVKTDSLGCVVPGCHLVGVPNPQGQIANNLLVYPNPTNQNQNTWLSFAMPKTEAVSIKILNLNGQLVKTQNFGLLPQGNHQIQMDLTLASGIYFIKLQTHTFNETVKWVVE